MAAARSLGEKRAEATRLVTAVADVRALHKELGEKDDPMAAYLGDFVEREEACARVVRARASAAPPWPPPPRWSPYIDPEPPW